MSIQEEGAQLKQWQLFGKQDFGSFFADITKVSTILACNNDDASALTDKDGKTYSTISGTESLYWIINTPLPVKVLGYSLINGNDAELDPKKVLLYGYDENGIATQLSSKTPTFQTRGTRLTYTTTTTKLFKRFTLVVDDETTPQVRLADVELYSSAIVDADNPYIHMPSSVEASADGLSNTELIGKLNDASRTTAYRAAFTQPVAITYTYDQPVSINAYTISAAKNEPTRDPASWTLEGSNDGNTWAQIDSQTGEAFSQRYATQFYTTGTTPSYKYYRLTVTATNGAEQLQIGELQLFTLEPASTDDPTGINEIERTNIEDGAIYNIAGQRLQKLQRGINIVNGKKILIK